MRQLTGTRTHAIETPVWEYPPIHVAACYLPHDRIGGDFYEILPLGEEHLGIWIGDVSGHGPEAAAVKRAATRLLFERALVGPPGDPLAVLQEINLELYCQLGRNTFITAYYGVLHRPSGRLTYVRAGHCRPILVSSDGVVSILDAPGIAFGLDPDALFRDAMAAGRATLDRDALLVLYTDGLVEAFSPRRGTYGIDRLHGFLRSVDRSAGVEEIRSRILGELSGFLGDTQLGDDLTLLCIKNEPGAAGPHGVPR
ncbi:MAG: PP2C family protein-serine/threonine phosphatase [Planctomycetota bacterium]